MILVVGLEIMCLVLYNRCDNAVRLMKTIIMIISVDAAVDDDDDEEDGDDVDNCE